MYVNENKVETPEDRTRASVAEMADRRKHRKATTTRERETMEIIEACNDSDETERKRQRRGIVSEDITITNMITRGGWMVTFTSDLREDSEEPGER